MWRLKFCRHLSHKTQIDSGVLSRKRKPRAHRTIQTFLRSMTTRHCFKRQSFPEYRTLITEPERNQYMAKPSKFAHVVYSTRCFEQMIDWYQRVFGVGTRRFGSDDQRVIR